mgnify:CR=1 FL=1
MFLPLTVRSRRVAAHFFKYMDKVRIGIVGLGNIGQIHAKSLLEGKIERGVLTAVADAFPDKLGEYEEKGLKAYGSGEDLIASGEIDALIIATPHFQHTTLGIAALEAGLHIMVEKPISAHKADAEDLTYKEIESIVYGLSFAGHEIVSNMLSNGLISLLRHRPYWEELCADPGLIPNAVEEILRFNSPQTSWRRVAMEEVGPL